MLVVSGLFIDILEASCLLVFFFCICMRAGVVTQLVQCGSYNVLLIFMRSNNTARSDLGDVPNVWFDQVIYEYTRSCASQYVVPLWS